MYDTGLADRIRAKAVSVVEVAGWKTRGSSAFRPRGSGNHHTAGSSRGTVPSLNTCLYGRTDVPGPLANVLQSREANPWEDKAYVLAAGKANHGGVGTWTGGSGTVNENVESHGLEIEHVGTGKVHSARLEIAARIQAAFLEAPGSSRDASMCWQHFEYARPLGRKIDFFDLSPLTAALFRQRVKFWIGRTTTIPVDSRGINTPVTREDDFIVDAATEKKITSIVRAELAEFGERVAPSGIRIKASDRKSGEPVYYTDLQSYIFEAKVDGKYDTLRKAILRMQGRSDVAQPFERALIEQMLDMFPDVKRLS